MTIEASFPCSFRFPDGQGCQLKKGHNLSHLSDDGRQTQAGDPAAMSLPTARLKYSLADKMAVALEVARTVGRT